MNGAVAELVRRGTHALRRSGAWWGVGIVLLALVSVAYWPSLEGSDAMNDLLKSSEDLMKAFGAEDLSTAAGYLDGQMYALMLPLLFSGLAIAATSAVTAGDEDAGRMELVQALPVSRQALWLSRLAAALLVLAAVVLVTAIVVAASIGPFSLDGVTAGRVFAATGACGLLAAFHGAVAYALGGGGASRGTAAGLAVAVLVAGYVADFVLPLADALAGARKLSPWYWGIGSQPVSDGPPGWWPLLLVGVTVALVAYGTAAVSRRDIRSA